MQLLRVAALASQGTLVRRIAPDRQFHSANVDARVDTHPPKEDPSMTAAGPSPLLVRFFLTFTRIVVAFLHRGESPGESQVEAEPSSTGRMIAVSEAPFVMISSDGHAGAVMEDYRPYLDPQYREDFDAFLPEWNRYPRRTFDPPKLAARLDREFVDEWIEKMFVTGRDAGFSDPERRLKEVEREGVCAEVIFPDFIIPFALVPPGTLSESLDPTPPPDEEHEEASFRAYNRWLVDYMSIAPERFAGMALVSWQGDIEDAIADIRWAHAAGLKGIVLPGFAPEMPLYHLDFEPIWNVLEELGMIVNSHIGNSTSARRPLLAPGIFHEAAGIRVRMPENVFGIHNMLSHLVWGGVFERHPNLKFVFTEQGTGWVVPELIGMDYFYEGSYFRTDYKDVLRSKPSEYFQRQCFMGSSIFSKAEVEGRHKVGIDKMMLGMDFPHHEGTLVETTEEYLRATLGASQVPLDEARMLLGFNAANVFGFDLDRLLPVAERIGLRPETVLSPPERDLFPRGDVHRPASESFG
jgi:predicted TIM-barrel fold metal-dependent hydrolase